MYVNVKVSYYCYILSQENNSTNETTGRLANAVTELTTGIGVASWAGFSHQASLCKDEMFLRFQIMRQVRPLSPYYTYHYYIP